MPRLNNSDRKTFYMGRLEDHRQLLRSAIAGIGKGEVVLALLAATSIRVLLHESGSSIPLLKRMRNDYLALPIEALPSPHPSEYSPLMRKVTIMHLPFGVSVGGSSTPFLNPKPDKSTYVTCSLGMWWTQPVLKVPGCAPLSRKEVVLGVANKEGAHVDDKMSENYRRVLESEPIRFTNGLEKLAPVNVTRFTVGQAAIELLGFLDQTFPALPQSLS